MHRRSFLTSIVAGAGAVMGLVIAVPGLRYLLDPLWRSRTRSGFIRVIPLAAVSRDGERKDDLCATPCPPMRVTVSADRWDAYTHYPPGPIGNVWLLGQQNKGSDTDEGGAPRIRCLQTICPHLGCGIDYAADRGVFGCPCHASEFDARGRRLSGPSPRDMDELECRVTEPDEKGRRWIEVRYVEFQTGAPDKRPVA